MSTTERDAGGCFLVAEDSDFRFGDTPAICDGLGAFIYSVTDAKFAESLIEFYKAECPNREFDLVIVPADSLTLLQHVLVNRELSRSDGIGRNLGCDEYRTTDPIFAAIGRCAVTLERLETELRHVLENSLHRPSQVENGRPDSDTAWYYLQATYDESIFNHDPVTLGTVVGDPNYYPLESGTLTFFKVQGEVVAQRLIRLFDRVVKPKVERQDETRLRVAFSYQHVGAFDEDETFLIEEELDSVKTEVEHLDRKWEARIASQSGNSPDTQQRRPLEGELFSCQRLYDQSRRWSERLGGTETESPAVADQPEDPPPPDEDTTPSDEPIPEELLRVGLPTALIAAIGLRDLNRVRVFYPGVIPEEEARALHETLAANLTSATKLCKLEGLLEIAKIPASDEFGSDVELSGLISMLALHHPDVKIDPSSPDSISQNLDIAVTKSKQDALEPVPGIVARIQQAMLFDCRVPCPVGDDSFQEPQRFLQMLRAYWEVVRQVVLQHIDMPIGYRPNPLLPLVVNFKARIHECFSRLDHIENAEDARQRLASLVDILLSGELDDLSAVPEWSYDQIGSIDRFIEETRLAIGAKSYPLTPAEDICLNQAQKAVDEYEASMKEKWTKISTRMALMRKTDNNHAPPPTPATDENAPDEPKTFEGGELVFLAERVTLCGADICSGPRSKSRRIVLELLSRRRRDGSFVSFSGEELKTEAKNHGVNGTAAGWIRDLRNDIKTSLLNQAGIKSGRYDVILSRDTGYRFADCLTVQFVDEPMIADITDTDEGSIVPNDDVLDDTASGRRAWILQQLAEGVQLKAPMVADRFRCSVKTARRDLAALKDEGRIEFVGSTRTGYYRICQDLCTDG